MSLLLPSFLATAYSRILSCESSASSAVAFTVKESTVPDNSFRFFPLYEKRLKNNWFSPSFGFVSFVAYESVWSEILAAFFAISSPSSPATKSSPSGKSIVPLKPEPHLTSLVTSMETVYVSPGAMEKSDIDTVMLSPHARTATASIVSIPSKRLPYCLSCIKVFIIIRILFLEFRMFLREAAKGTQCRLRLPRHIMLLFHENLLHASCSVTNDVHTLLQSLSYDTVSIEYRAICLVLCVNSAYASAD